jgi:hypothetical protein
MIRFLEVSGERKGWKAREGYLGYEVWGSGASTNNNEGNIVTLVRQTTVTNYIIE